MRSRPRPTRTVRARGLVAPLVPALPLAPALPLVPVLPFVTALLLAAALLTACTGTDAPSGPNVGQALEQQYSSTVQKALPSVVEITSESGVGSGVVYDDLGHVVTNAHVVGNSQAFQVRLSTTSATFPATLVGSYPAGDLAVIRIENPGRPVVATFGRSADVQVGDMVLAMGSPFGLEGTVTNGIVSALGRVLNEPPGGAFPGAVLQNAMQTSAPINPGNSGGALVNLDGQVIGISTAALVNPELGGSAPGIGFAIPADTARDVADQLIRDGTVTRTRRATLGITAVTVTDETGTPVGVGVAAVVPGGPADSQGVKVGDIIVRVDGTDVRTVQDLQTIIAAREPGQAVRLDVMRPPANEPLTFTVTLAELPAG